MQQPGGHGRIVVVEAPLQTLPASHLSPHQEPDDEAGSGHDQELQAVGHGHRPQPSESRVDGGQGGDHTHHRPGGRIRQAAHDRKGQEQGGGDDSQHQRPVLHLDEGADDPNRGSVACLQVFGVGVEPCPVHGQADEKGGQGPTQHRPHPVGGEVAESQHVSAAGVGHQVAGVDGGGIHGETHQPPGKAASRQEPIGAGAHPPAQVEAVEDDGSVEGNCQRPVPGAHDRYLFLWERPG